MVDGESQQEEAPPGVRLMAALRWGLVAASALAAVFAFVATGRPRPAAVAQQAALHVCPMHPEVTSRGPSKCPACGMELIAAAPAAALPTGNVAGRSSVRLTEADVLRLGVRTGEVERAALEPGVRAIGEVTTLAGGRAQVRFELAAEHANSVRRGQAARFIVLGAEVRVLSGAVTRVEIGAGRVRGVIELAQVDELVPGDAGEVELVGNDTPGLWIDKAALLYDGERSYVFVAEPEGLFVPRRVDLGGRSDAMARVLTGVSAGTPVVIAGTFALDAEARLRALAGGGAP